MKRKVLLKSAIVLMALSNFNFSTIVKGAEYSDFSGFIEVINSKGSSFKDKELYLANSLVKDKILETLNLCENLDQDNEDELLLRTKNKIEMEIQKQTALQLPVYIIQPGDSLAVISEAAKINITDLAELNGLSENSELIVGDILIGVLPSNKETAIVILDNVSSDNIKKASEMLGDNTNTIFVSQDEVNKIINDNNLIESNVTDEQLDQENSFEEELKFHHTNNNVSGQPTNEDTSKEKEQSSNTQKDNPKQETNHDIESKLKSLYGDDFNWDTFFDLDSDEDGIPDHLELFTLGYDPFKADSFGDGMNDLHRDPDGDGLTIGEELKLGTKILYGDSDYDGISDYDEYFVRNTDPLSEDSDNDGARDGWEVKNGYNPLDFNQSFNVTARAKSDKVMATVNTILSGKQAETLRVNALPSNFLINPLVPGYIAPAFDFNVSGTFDEAEIAFDLSAVTPTEDWNPTIYHFNEDKQLLEKVDTKYENGVASAIVNHFSKYIPLAKPIEWNTEIRKPDETVLDSGINLSFVLDDSGSMKYNDKDNRRILVTQDILNKLVDKKDEASIIRFTNYQDILYPQGNDFEEAKKALDSMKSIGGTNITKGVLTSLDHINLDNYPANSYVVLLTDGEDTRFNRSGYQEIIDKAKDKGIKIYTVNLVDGNEEKLQILANETGGRYFSAENSDDLIKIFDNIGQETVDFSRDTNGDGISDYYTKMIVDGKLVTGTGIPINQIFDVEKLKNLPDADGDGLANGKEVEVTYDKDGNITYLKMFSNPFSKDTDFDGIEDGQESVDRVRVFDVDPYKHLLIFSSAAYGDRTPEKITEMIHAFSNGTKEEIYNETYQSIENEGTFNPVFGNWELSMNVDDNADGSGAKFINIFKKAEYAEGFSASTYIADNNLVIAFKGSSDKVDWVWGNLRFPFMEAHYQSNSAKDFVTNVSKKYGLEDNKFNVLLTGHSLGGYVAQVGAAELIKDKVELQGLSYFNGLGQNKYSPNGAEVNKTLNNHIKENENFNIYHNRIKEDSVSDLSITIHAVNPTVEIPSPTLNKYGEEIKIHKGMVGIKTIAHLLPEFIFDLYEKGEIEKIEVFDDFSNDEYYSKYMETIKTSENTLDKAASSGPVLFSNQTEQVDYSTNAEFSVDKDNSSANTDSTIVIDELITNLMLVSETGDSPTNVELTSETSSSPTNVELTSETGDSPTNVELTSETSSSPTNVELTSETSSSPTNVELTSETSGSTNSVDLNSEASNSATSFELTSDINKIITNGE